MRRPVLVMLVAIVVLSAACAQQVPPAATLTATSAPTPKPPPSPTPLDPRAAAAKAYLDDVMPKFQAVAVAMGGLAMLPPDGWQDPTSRSNAERIFGEIKSNGLLLKSPKRVSSDIVLLDQMVSDVGYDLVYIADETMAAYSTVGQSDSAFTRLGNANVRVQAMIGKMKRIDDEAKRMQLQFGLSGVAQWLR